MRDDTLILCYHAVSDIWPADLSLPAASFRDQIRAKLDRGYRGTTLTESQAAGREGRTLVVTFDDGYLSTLTRAAPVLEELEVPATLFVPSDYISSEKPLSWPGIDRWLDGPHRQELKPLDWDQVRALAEAGWEIGSHTCSHPHLTGTDDSLLAHELADSRATIEAQLGTPCSTIAYPYGDVDDRVAAAAADAGYELGAGLPARWTASDDPLQLPRVGVYHGQGRFRFGLKTSPFVRSGRVLLGR